MISLNMKKMKHTNIHINYIVLKLSSWQAKLIQPNYIYPYLNTFWFNLQPTWYIFKKKCGLFVHFLVAKSLFKKMTTTNSYLVFPAISQMCITQCIHTLNNADAHIFILTGCILWLSSHAKNLTCIYDTAFHVWYLVPSLTYWCLLTDM